MLSAWSHMPGGHRQHDASLLQDAPQKSCWAWLPAPSPQPPTNGAESKRVWGEVSGRKAEPVGDHHPSPPPTQEKVWTLANPWEKCCKIPTSPHLQSHSGLSEDSTSLFVLAVKRATMGSDWLPILTLPSDLAWAQLRGLLFLGAPSGFH